MASNKAVRRIGGALGIIAVAAGLPAYIAGIPDVSGDRTARSAQWVAINGVPPLFYHCFYLLFLACLTMLVRRTANGRVFAPAVLAGGVTYVALSGVGVAIEIAFSATRLRFPNVALDPSLAYYAASTAGWIFLYSGLGTVVVVLGTCGAAWRTNLFPRWVLWVGALVIVLIALRFWFPLPGALASPAWILVLGSVMAFGRVHDETAVTSEQSS